MNRMHPVSVEIRWMGRVSGVVANIALVTTLIGASLIREPAVAHHSATMFEPVKTVTLTGVVKEFQYTNPHSWLIVTVAKPDGTTEDWGFEAEGPSSLLRAGIHKSDFSPGTKLTMTSHPMRDGRHAGTWVSAIRANDGKVFNPRGTAKNPVT